MYEKMVPFKDFKDKPRNGKVQFNLTEREVFKLLPEFKFVLEWRDSMQGAERELKAEEVVEFYNAFEEILLTAWGELSDDGLHFRKGGRYEFEESALFNACMVMFVSEPQESMKLIDSLLPKGMEDLVKKADENLMEAAKGATDDDLRAELERLRAQVGVQQSGASEQS